MGCRKEVCYSCKKYAMICDGVCGNCGAILEEEEETKENEESVRL